MTIPLLILAVGLAVIVPLAVLLHRRQREVEERTARTLARLRHRHTALTDLAAEAAREVAALYGYGTAAEGEAPAPSDS